MTSMAPIIIYNYIYFYHLDKFCLLPFYPDQITDNMSTSFAQTTALSRSAPVFTYSNSGPRSVQITFPLHRDMMNDLNVKDKKYLISNDIVDFTEPDYIDTLVNYLQAAALPQYQIYNSGKSKSVDPPMVAIRFGNDVFIKGVVTSGINVVFKKPIQTDGKYASVDINFTVSEVEPYNAETVVQKGSFRDIAAGINVNTFSRGIMIPYIGNGRTMMTK